MTAVPEGLPVALTVALSIGMSQSLGKCQSDISRNFTACQEGLYLQEQAPQSLFQIPLHPDYSGLGSHQISHCLSASLGRIFLNSADDGLDKEYNQDENAVLPISKQNGNSSSQQLDVDQRTQELSEEINR